MFNFNDIPDDREVMMAPEDTAAQTDTQEATQVHNEEADAANNCQRELQELQDKYFHLGADFKNYQRRVEKEREQWTFKAQERLLHGVLAIADDVERALQEQHKLADRPELKAWAAGLDMIAKSLHKFLEQSGVQEIAQMTEFDPNLHEALVQVEDVAVPAGHIVAVFQKGYTYKGMVLRPAKVSVSG
jgi:molecular chaperone GrpE